MGKTRAHSEPTAYAEIGAYLHKRPGKAQVKTYTSVNEPLKVDAAEETRQIKKVRVEVHVKEDKGVKDGQVYQKDVDTVQISDGGDSEPTTSLMDDLFGGSPDGSTGDDFKKWTKNIVDKLIDAKNLQWVAIGAALTVAALALGLALV